MASRTGVWPRARLAPISIEMYGPTVWYFIPQIVLFGIGCCTRSSLPFTTGSSSTRPPPDFWTWKIEDFPHSPRFPHLVSLVCRRNGGSRLSDGAATAIPDLHRSHLKQCNAHETWYSRAGLNQCCPSAGNWYESFRYTLCVRTSVQKCLLLRRQSSPRSTKPKILPFSTGEER